MLEVPTDKFTNQHNYDENTPSYEGLFDNNLGRYLAKVFRNSLLYSFTVAVKLDMIPGQ